MKIKEPSTAYKTQSKPFTYQDYQNLTEDDHRYQVINGELIMTPSPVPLHQRISRRLTTLLNAHVGQHDLGEVFYAPLDVVLDNYNVFQPDILFVSHKNANVITKKNIQGAPDLVIEILSPSTGYYDLIEKKEAYAKFGTREYWIVDPQKKWVEVFEIRDGDFESKGRFGAKESFKSAVIPGLEIDLTEVFRPQVIPKLQ
jgi:Uma2 family endonuclease